MFSAPPVSNIACAGGTDPGCALDVDSTVEDGVFVARPRDMSKAVAVLLRMVIPEAMMALVFEEASLIVAGADFLACVAFVEMFVAVDVHFVVSLDVDLVALATALGAFLDGAVRRVAAATLGVLASSAVFNTKYDPPARWFNRSPRSLPSSRQPLSLYPHRSKFLPCCTLYAPAISPISTGPFFRKTAASSVESVDQEGPSVGFSVRILPKIVRVDYTCGCVLFSHLLTRAVDCAVHVSFYCNSKKSGHSSSNGPSIIHSIQYPLRPPA